MASIDIQSEEFRCYFYADGTVLRIDNPVEVFITNSGSHRVITESGMVYRPEPGYIGIAWQPRKGEPAFVA